MRVLCEGVSELVKAIEEKFLAKRVPALTRQLVEGVVKAAAQRIYQEVCD
jgi:hypothetical protein